MQHPPLMSANPSRTSRYLLLLAIPCITLLGSCVVGKKKYESLLKDRNKLDSTLVDLNGKHKTLNAQHDALNARTLALLKDTAALGKIRRGLVFDLQTADRNYSALMTTSNKQTLELSKKNATLGKDLAARERRVQELEGLIADKERATRELRDRVAKSLLGFNEKDLTIQVKNGKVYVSLSEQLLFASGRYDVDPKGQDALKTLAGVLRKDTSVNVTIEGHTDDVPMRAGTAGMKDNWDLSVLRATSIARLLADEGVQGHQLIASGRSKYLPLDPQKTADARTKNRRTEIILTPKLDDLFKMLGN
jgi:chemotaxis protein MotB